MPGGGQMEVGEENLFGAQESAFRFLRLLHLHDQFGAFEDSFVVFEHLRASRFVVGIRKSSAKAGVALDENFMSALDELVGCRGRQGDTKLLLLNFFGDSDDHALTEVDWIVRCEK